MPTGDLDLLLGDVELLSFAIAKQPFASADFSTADVELLSFAIAKPIFASADFSTADVELLSFALAKPIFASADFSTDDVQLSAIARAGIEADLAITLGSVVFQGSAEGLVAWLVAPQDRPMEVLEWKTNIIRTKSSEQRIALRAKPKQSFLYKFRLSPAMYSQVQGVVFGRAQSVQWVPLWTDGVYVGDVSTASATITVDTTKSAFSAGGWVLLRQGNGVSDLVKVAQVHAGSLVLTRNPAYTMTAAWAIPVVSARIPEGVEFTRGTGDDIRAECTVVHERCELPNVSPTYPTFEGLSVCTDRPKKNQDLTENLAWQFDKVDYGVGVPKYFRKYNRADMHGALMWETNTHAGTHALKAWFMGLNGKQKPFWMPSWNKDYELASDVLSADTSINIKYAGFAALAPVRCFMLVLNNGTTLYRRVTSIESIGDREILNLAAPLGQAVQVSDVALMCALRRARLDVDRLEFQHLEGGGVIVTAPLVDAP